jgi:hypothetical protein
MFFAFTRCFVDESTPPSRLLPENEATHARKKNARTYRFFLTLKFQESIPSLAAMQRVAAAMSNQ